MKQIRHSLYSRLGPGYCLISVNVAKEAFVRAATPDCVSAVSVSGTLADEVVGMMICRLVSTSAWVRSPARRLDFEVVDVDV